MTCREMTDFLVDYVSGELDPAVVAEFEPHLERCPNCRVYVTQYRETIIAARLAVGAGAASDAARGAADRADDPPPMPDELVRAILNAIRKP
ncbi:MAG: zf-HC2 domain-containing protein [Vicinamibacterales bacterium]